MATPAVKVYGWAISPFVSRALLALEEAGVDYELVPMSRQAGDHRRPEHLARNVRTSRPTMNLFVGFTSTPLIGHPSLRRRRLTRAPVLNCCSLSGRCRCSRTATSRSSVSSSSIGAITLNMT